MGRRIRGTGEGGRISEEW
ncbi:hypothetical protein E2C01_097730 [Portunus trituberculatus]|uniref:Uncharacterized protein n=1 Tax=Portunus trituberculatus TaxID=210409 RepID=A0A5B7K568_PORTR|nr:hypothetical protein [Portunus trituberculatus]